MRVINFFQFKRKGFDNFLYTAVKVSEGKYIYWAVMYQLHNHILTNYCSNNEVSEFLRTGQWIPLFEGENK